MLDAVSWLYNVRQYVDPDEWQIRKDLEGSGHGGTEENYENPVRIAGILTF
jgi:hypothetical protein